MSDTILDIKNISKSYRNKRREVAVLKDLNLAVTQGLFYGIKGDSGNGKSTLLSIIGGLQKPDEGAVIYNGKDITGLDDNSLAVLRRHDIVYISQFQDVIPELTVAENVRIVDYFDGDVTGSGKESAEDILSGLGLFDLKDELPETLSGGELRRLTIARAIYAAPKVLLLDEPTNDLDSTNKQLVIDILKKLTARGITVIVATHDDNVADSADVIYSLNSDFSFNICG